MTPVRRRDLVALAGGVAFAAWLVVRAAYGALPPLHWWLPVPLGVLAVAEAMGAWTLHARLSAQREGRRSPGRTPATAARPVEPMLVARLVVLAQASAWVGAVLAGLWAGVLLHTAPAVGRLSAASGDTVSAVVGVVLAAALAIAALWLEHVCKVPPGEDDDESRGVRSDPR
jgi:predicted outer membrane lipoprotein